MSNSYIAQQRAVFEDELSQASVKNDVFAMMVTEDETNPGPCFEALLNRTDYVNSHGQKQTVHSMIHGGFYGPANRGMYPRTIAQINANHALKAKLQAAFDAVMAGSDQIKGFTDQGMPTDPNGRRKPNVRIGGNVFNDWAGGPNGAAGAAAWRVQFEAEAAKAASASQPAPVSAADHSIKSLQAALNKWMGKTVLDIDGDYGELTKAVVKLFQKANNIAPVDGQVGPQTWTALEKEPPA